MMHPRYLHCKACKSHWRVEVLSPTTVALPVANHCPLCGQACASELDRDLDYWYVLAEAYLPVATIKGAKLIQQLYDLWDGKEHDHFGDFVREVLSQQ